MNIDNSITWVGASYSALILGLTILGGELVSMEGAPSLLFCQLPIMALIILASSHLAILAHQAHQALFRPARPAPRHAFDR